MAKDVDNCNTCKANEEAEKSKAKKQNKECKKQQLVWGADFVKEFYEEFNIDLREH